LTEKKAFQMGHYCILLFMCYDKVNSCYDIERQNNDLYPH